MSRRRTAALPVSAALATALTWAFALPAAAELPGALVVLQAPAQVPGAEPAGTPLRFALMKDGRVFVGGSAEIRAGRLERRELSAWRKRLGDALKALRRQGRIALGGDRDSSVRLQAMEDDERIDVFLDPADVPPTFQPLAELVTDLLRFDHPSLARHAPESFALQAREGRLPGGCRRWSLAYPIEQAVASPVVFPAKDVAGWPTGAMPASVCAGEKRYVVTFRPLLPGEQP